MFKKKYVFETKKTKSKRYVQNIFVILLIVFTLYFVNCVLILSVAHYETDRAREAFYKRSPDMIAIFTGDTGRIPLGLQKALEYKTPQLFISGVYTSNSFRTLVIGQNKELLNRININSGLVEIDYRAHNTVENVMATLNFLRSNSNFFKSVLIVSSDYHLFRIKLILSLMKNPLDNYTFYFIGVDTDLTNYRNIKTVLKEVYKTFKTYGFFLFWESEISSSEKDAPLDEV